MSRQLFVLLSSAIIITGCSFGSQNSTSTTFNPQVAVLQKQVDKLQAQVNAAPLPTPTTKAPKPTAHPYITRTGCFNRRRRYWVTLDKWYYGACG
jgi:hypothetical protein